MLRKMFRLCQIAITCGAITLVAGAFSSCLAKPKTPEGGLLYKGPVEISVGPGHRIAGTDILYVGLSDGMGMAEFEIEGQRARKKVGDSLDWKGEPVAGVSLTLNLRVLLITEQAAHTGGTVAMTIAAPSPREIHLGEMDSPKFNMPVTYRVAKGEYIPGSLLSYQGRDEERGAQLGGIEEYPYRKTGDSIVWEGELRDNVFLRLDMRVLLFNENALHVGGLATVWLGE